MDPNAALSELLDLCSEVEAKEDSGETDPPMLQGEDAARMAELVRALDGWLHGGGFLPARWKIAGGGR